MSSPNNNNTDPVNKEDQGSSDPSTATGDPAEEKSSGTKDALYSSSDSDDGTENNRDAFFAFVPQLAAYGAGIVGGEVSIAAKAVTAGPGWLVQYLQGTVQFYQTHPRILYDEVISGFTVAIMQVPESIAFSFVAGVPPLSGLHATFWMATVTGLLGGKPGMISGAAGALAVVVTELTADDGVLDYLETKDRLNVLYMTMFLCGIAQILFAWLRLAKLVRLIPETGMIGFMNGLAIIIFLAQLPAFQKCDEAPRFVECKIDDREYLTFADDTWQLILSLVHVGLCMAIMKFFPSAPKIGKIIPASLVGLLVGTLIEHTLFREVFKVATRTVEETAQMSGDFPKFDWPAVPTDSETINTIIVYAVTLAAIGGVESVLTLQACNEITDTVPKISDSNQELFAQGLANLVCGLFRAMGGDAMIGQSTINIMNGARYRVSSTMSGVFMLLFVVLLSPFIELLPVSTLTGVLFMVVLSTFQWKTFIILRYGRLSDSATIVLVTLIAVFFNLAVAILVGIIFSALVHAWDSGSHVDADIAHKRMVINGTECDCKYVHVRGAIFFSSARHFINLFSVTEDPETVVIDLKDALVIDHSAVAAIQGITHRFDKVGKRVLLTNVPVKSHGRLHRTGDHEQLRQQMTNAADIVDVEGQPSSSSLQPPRSSSRLDEANVGEALGNLHMFQTPIESIETELSQLEKDQGSVSIHSVKKDS